MPKRPRRRRIVDAPDKDVYRGLMNHPAYWIVGVFASDLFVRGPRAIAVATREGLQADIKLDKKRKPK
jgi:hypothetical protein